ncbi:Stem-specific protein TSJT1 [Vitis vinifera]|uniref:Stem-specific protein TSJT1 n=1 Tax=Vitis vinifera TaxID=29760 RepID=A0A438I8X1_VITVI|nr:Stem-specific protein TSJT1 [Vitis vinifera]
MLAIFHKAFAHPPEELNSPASRDGSRKPKLPEETLREFLSAHPANTFSMSFGTAAALAYVSPDRSYPTHQRLFGGFDDIYCLFMGSLNNLCILNRQYGLSKGSNEAILVIEAYRTLRDRGPYPADQGSDGGVKLFWGVAADGSVVISDDLGVIKAGCAKSFAPFPTGCMFHSDGGLMSFEHPMNKMKAMPRIDSEGVMCGANFKVDVYSRINSMPRVGSEVNWSNWEDYH